MTLEKIVFVKELGVYSGVMVYALYPSLSTLENLRRLGWKSWLENLAKWLAKAILSSSFLYRIAISSKPFPLPRIKSGEEEKKEMSLLWARTLDDIAICTARAYYSIKEQREGILKKAPHIAIRTSEESLKTDKSIFIESLVENLSKTIIMYNINPLLEFKLGNIIFRCKPDLYLISVLRNNKKNLQIIRGFVIEIHETSFAALKSTWHILPRLYLYALAFHRSYGITPLVLSVPLSMENEFGILCLANVSCEQQYEDLRKLPVSSFVKIYQKLNYILTSDNATSFSSKSAIFCSECKYKRICKFYRG